MAMEKENKMKAIIQKMVKGKCFTNTEVVRIVRELSRDNISEALKGMFVTIFRMCNPTTDMFEFGEK